MRATHAINNIYKLISFFEFGSKSGTAKGYSRRPNSGTAKVHSRSGRLTEIGSDAHDSGKALPLYVLWYYKYTSTVGAADYR